MRRTPTTTGVGLLVGFAVGLALAACFWETWLGWRAEQEQVWCLGVEEAVAERNWQHLRGGGGSAPVLPATPRRFPPGWAEPLLLGWLGAVLLLCTFAGQLTGRRLSGS